MAHKAYVLIEVERGLADTVVAELSYKPGLLTAEPTFGRHDVVALIEAPNFDDLAEVVRSVIAEADHITHTETLVVSHLRHRR